MNTRIRLGKVQIVVVVASVLASFFVGFVSLANAAPTASVLGGGIAINEILIDPNGTNNFDTDGNGTPDTLDEFVEIYNLSGAAIDISGFELWDAGNGNWFIFPGSTVLGAGNYAVVVCGVQADGSLPAVSGGNLAFDAGRTGGVINNSGDNVVLYDPGADQYIQLRYNGDAADNPPAGYSGFSATATLVGFVENWGNDSDGISLVREPAGDDNIVLHNTISSNNASPGDASTGGGPDYTLIYDIQYTTAPSGDSPEVGNEVTTEGIVTAIFYNGYFIEDPAGGAWSGLFVYNSNTPALGDRVRLTGMVSEYYNLTQLGSLTGYDVLSSGNPVPSPEIRYSGYVSQEQWEGVLVSVENVIVTNENLGYGEWSVSDGTGDVVIDDKGSYTYAPTNGDTLGAIIGPLDYSYGAFKILPRDDGDIVFGGPAITPIYDIQYTADLSGDSPYRDQAGVATEGVVTARFYNGYFIEYPTGGAWNGLWVYDSNTPTLGDRVRVTGTVVEYYNLTQLSSLTSYEVVSSGNPIPAPEILSTADVSQEQWEGVLVRVENVTVTNEDLGYGEWSVSDGTGDVVIDDKGDYTYAPTNGDTLDAIIGPLDYSYGAFKILPRDDDDIILQVPLPDMIINEVDADTPSTDVLEFVELYDGGVGNTPLDGFVVVFYNGNGDTSYNSFDLDGFTTDANGYFVLGNADVDPTPSIIFGGNGLQNGADAVAVYAGDAADFPNGTTLTTDDLVDAIVYDTNDGDDAGLLTLLNVGQPQVNEDGAGDKDNHSNQRCPNGSGGARNTDTYDQYVPTPGRGNICSLCGDPATFIHDIQGSGASSPEVGNVHVIEGVVVGDFQNIGGIHLGGFFLQEEDADVDGDPLTSEGIFVYDGSYPAVDVSVGDVVRVVGEISEYYDLTELGYIGMAVCGSSSIAPTEVDLPADLEPYEGMLVTLPEELTASQNYFQGRYGQVTMSSEGRLFNPTNTYRPLTPEAITMAEENLLRMFVLDDGTTSQNPDPIPYIGAEDTLRAGDTVAGLTGVVDYGPINSSYPPARYYRVHPTGPVDFTRVNERTAAPDDVGGVIKIASFNVLNYFNGDGMGGGFPTSRGASTIEEFDRQRTKIINAIVAMDADVIGLMEIENDGYDEYSAIADLVNGLNDVVGAGTYAFIDPDVAQIGTDEIAVGFIYRPGAVTPVGAAAILDSSVDPDFNSDYNRPALAQTFERSTGGGMFTAAVNHLKSKGSSCDAIGDPDLGDGQGNCNLTRTYAAEVLADWLLGDPTGSGDPDFFIIGDLNAYAMEDPIIAIEDAGYTNLVKAFSGTWAYSYIFDGQAGYLDHALASPGAFSQVSGATMWHINTDEPSVIDYNTEFKPVDLYTSTPYRSSDHDPVIVGFCDAIPPEVEVRVTPDTLWPPNHKYVTVEATVDVFDATGDTTLTLVSVTSNEPDDGPGKDKSNDIVIVDDFTFRLRAERSGGGDGRIYTITYVVTDACGNSTLATATVTVPHDQGK